ncbi:MAG: phosphoribosylformylglycinamidine cyclo-ligase [Planctomycetales bacterium]
MTTSQPPAGVTYRDAGVDLELYEQAMERLPAFMKRTHTPRVMDLAGGFAGLFRMDHDAQFPRNYKEPVLVSGTDGVGTKLKVALLTQTYNTVGIDLVAMSVNDCLCLGAEPLFFLDYLALGKDDPDLIAKLVEGVTEGCVQAKAALLGGETAIMPDIYSPGDFDMAGFCVAVAEKSELIEGKDIQPGDVVIGLGSSGFHSNGYSLVRKVVFDVAKLKIDQHIPELGQTVGEALLTPTTIYVQPILELLKTFKPRTTIRGLAHITGGGIADNLVRILPENCHVEIDGSSWQAKPIFHWLQKLGNIDREEMFRVFNMGIGFVIVAAPEAADGIQQTLTARQIPNWLIGNVKAGAQGVTVRH